VSETSWERKVTAYLPVGMIVVVGLVMLVWSWGTWPDALIDFGRELYVPWQIGEGKVLYRDLAWFNGPLSPYLNAAVFSLLGVSLRSLVLFNLLWLSGVCVVLYRLLLRISNRFAATSGCVAFLTLFAFGQMEFVGNFNWVCPYSHAMTHGVGLSLLGVWLLVRYADTRQTWAIACAGLATGLVALGKPEILLACGFAMTIGLAVLVVRDGIARHATGIVWFVGLLVMPVAVAFGLLRTAMPMDDALRATAGGWIHVFNDQLRSQYFYRAGMGFDQPGARLRILGIWMAIQLVLLVVAVVPNLFLERRGRLWVSVVVAIVVFLPRVIWEIPWARAAVAGPRASAAYAYSPLPVYMLVIVGFAVLAWRRSAGKEASDRTRGFALLVFSTLATALLLKILLNARLANYGFALSLPAFVLVVVALTHWLPDWVGRRGGSRIGVRIAGVALLLIPVTGHLAEDALWFGLKDRSLGQGPDAFRMDRRYDGIPRILAGLARTPSDATVVVLPEGVMINYLARRKSSSKYYNFMPPEFLMFGEDAILRDLVSHPPDYVVLADRRTREYRLPFFGTHYGQRILDWVWKNYTAVKGYRVGPRPLDPEQPLSRLMSMWLTRRDL